MTSLQIKKIKTFNARLFYRECLQDSAWPFSWQEERAYLQEALNELPHLRLASDDDFIYFFAAPDSAEFSLQGTWVAKEIIGHAEIMGEEEFALYDLDQGSVYSMPLNLEMQEEPDLLTVIKIKEKYQELATWLEKEKISYSSTWRIVMQRRVKENRLFCDFFLQIFE